MYEYNTDRNPIILKGHGRNIQKLVTYISAIKEKSTRTEYTKKLIALMGKINVGAHMKNVADHYRKLWDDVFIISDYTLDIESPYPIPDKQAAAKKPNKLPYRTGSVKLLSYGRNIEMFLKKAITIEDEAQRAQVVIQIAKFMQRFGNKWARDNMDEGIIIEHIKRITDNQLSVDFEKIQIQLKQSQYKTNSYKPFQKNQRQKKEK